ncbi:glycosyltransferase family 2 protein [Candidatus Saccharibacteria bacterium]|nr:glycosyltransferase family 2 protein [Candidatus Saccharibacteria bacterium]
MNPKLSIIVPAYNSEQFLLNALDSIPKAQDTEVIIIDDGSTDDTWAIADRWRSRNKDRFYNIRVIKLEKNRGVAHAMNTGFDLAEGEYIGSLSSDDWYIDDFSHIRQYLDGENDLVYFDLEVNDGSWWRLTPETKKHYVGAVKFIRREFLGDTRVPSRKYKEDLPFSSALYAKNPKEVFTGIVLKHYSWPREGSLSWQATQDYANDRAKYNENAGILSQNDKIV